MPRARVLIVDDSALMRELLSQLLSKDPGLEVIGTAADPFGAWQKIQTLSPDVLTLDVEMPKMDGLTFLGKLMRARPMPVVMVSTLTERGCETTLRALELGAIDYVTKPKLDVTRGTLELGAEIAGKVRAAAQAKPRRSRSSTAPKPLAHRAPQALLKSTQQVIAMAASTGGTEALREVLSVLPRDAPGIVIVQHMPLRFTQAFARRLDGVCQISVREARDGDRIVPGVALIAPGDSHMLVTRSGSIYSVRLSNDPPVNHHRPAADVLFESCARCLGANAVAVVLTGMGADGARGLHAMKQAGARTIAQDEATCVVFGMPKEAILTGAVDHVVPLDRVAETMLRLAE
jgi:two-component system, chemotaxis family, protein-glutamate methylesterase/glutaminase